MRISAAIMHADWYPNRRAWATGLAIALSRSGIRDVRIVKAVKGAGVWHTAKACWTYGVRAGADWHVVLQDDVVACQGIGVGLEAVANLIGGRGIMNLFTIGRDTGIANRAGAKWIVQPGGVSGQGTLVPVGLIPGFLDWAAQKTVPGESHDDVRLAWYMATRRPELACYAYHKSLLNHVGQWESSIGHNGLSNAGEFVLDARSVDWADGFGTPVRIGPWVRCAFGVSKKFWKNDEIAKDENEQWRKAVGRNAKGGDCQEVEGNSGQDVQAGGKEEQCLADPEGVGGAGRRASGQSLQPESPV